MEDVERIPETDSIGVGRCLQVLLDLKVHTEPVGMRSAIYAWIFARQDGIW